MATLIPKSFRPIGPSRHREMRAIQRAFQYRLTLAGLSLHTLPKRTFSQSFDLKASVYEAQTLTHSTSNDPAELAHLVRVLLAEALAARPDDLTLELSPASEHDYAWNR